MTRVCGQRQSFRRQQRREPAHLVAHDDVAAGRERHRRGRLRGTAAPRRGAGRDPGPNPWRAPRGRAPPPRDRCGRRCLAEANLDAEPIELARSTNRSAAGTRARDGVCAQRAICPPIACSRSTSDVAQPPIASRRAASRPAGPPPTTIARRPLPQSLVRSRPGRPTSGLARQVSGLCASSELMQTLAPMQGRTARRRRRARFRQQFGIGDMGAHHADEIGVAGRQDLFGQRQSRDAADRGDGQVDRRFDGARQMAKGAERRRRRRPVIDARELERVVARGDADVVDLRRRERAAARSRPPPGRRCRPRRVRRRACGRR